MQATQTRPREGRSATQTELKRFIECIFKPDDIIEFRLLKKVGSDTKVLNTWHKASEAHRQADTLIAQNNAGWNIYVGANSRKKNGGATADDVSVARCLFVDFDHTTEAKVQETLDELGFPPPTLLMNSGHGIHAYWRIQEPMTNLQQWTQDQKRLIATVDSDKAIHDPPRVMRLPGFINHKEPVAQSCIIDAETARIYLLADLRENLASIEAPKAPPPRRIAPPASDDEKVLRATAYAAKWEAASEGERNNQAMRHAADMTRDFDLPDADAWPILWNWNLTNSPPLEEAELRKALTNGEKYGTHPIGSKLTEARTQRTMPQNDPTHSTEVIPGDFNLTDAGNGERMAALFGHKLKYDWSRGCWLYYDGRRWDRSSGRRNAEKLAVKTARSIIDVAEKLSHEKRGRYLKWSYQSESSQRRAAMISATQHADNVASYVSDYDSDPWLLNCLNGTIDLRTGELLPHKPDDMITKLAPANYDPDATSELWEEVISTACEHNESLIDFLRRAIGYTATGDTSEEKMFLVHGGTATGKSTTMEAVKATLGDYAQTADFETFLKRKNVGGARNDVAKLAGSRFVISIEVEEGKRLAEGLIKTLTGGDTISARFLYQESFEFVPQFKLWLAANSAPRLRDDDAAMWRRILRIPLDHTIPEADRDPQVKATLKNPNISGAAILAWIVKGCLDWQEDGLKIPEIVAKSTAAYRQDQNPIGDFLDEDCEFNETMFVPVTELRTAYDDWAKANGAKYTLGPREFNIRFEAKGAYRKSHRFFNEVGTEKLGKCWMGVTLQSNPRQIERNST